jgi:hypothetical protein
MVILERDVALLNERLDSNEASTIPDQLLPSKFSRKGGKVKYIKYFPN